MPSSAKSLVIGMVTGILVTILAIRYFSPKDPPAPDLKPYQDSIRILEKEWHLAEGRAQYHIHRADSFERRLHLNDKKLKHDIKVIEAFTPHLRDRWNDSVLRAAGLR